MIISLGFVSAKRGFNAPRVFVPTKERNMYFYPSLYEIKMFSAKEHRFILSSLFHRENMLHRTMVLWTP